MIFRVQNTGYFLPLCTLNNWVQAIISNSLRGKNLTVRFWPLVLHILHPTSRGRKSSTSAHDRRSPKSAKGTKNLTVRFLDDAPQSLWLIAPLSSLVKNREFLLPRQLDLLPVAGYSQIAKMRSHFCWRQKKRCNLRAEVKARGCVV
jgi:hypothetical protein